MEVQNIKPEKREEFIKWIEINSKDDYSKATTDGALTAMKVLDDKTKTPKDANDSLYGLGLTGFMAGCIAGAISEFHERGPEFNKFWNAMWGMPEAEGTINPAIVTFTTKD